MSGITATSDWGPGEIARRVRAVAGVILEDDVAELVGGQLASIGQTVPLGITGRDVVTGLVEHTVVTNQQLSEVMLP